VFEYVVQRHVTPFRVSPERVHNVISYTNLTFDHSPCNVKLQ
jgi:hypothetical protein